MLQRDLPSCEWEPLVESARSAWRWEQQPFYASDLATGCPQRWFAGDRRPAEYIDAFARTVVAELIASGATRQRVRVIDEPMTWFQEWANEQADINRAVGEPIWLLPRRRAADLDLVGDPLVDWWLLNDRTVLLLRHDPTGELLGVDRDDSIETVLACAAIRDTAMREVLAVA